MRRRSLMTSFDLERLKPLQQRLSFLLGANAPCRTTGQTSLVSLLMSCSVTPAATQLVFALALSTVHSRSSTLMATQRWSWPAVVAWNHGAGPHGRSTVLKLQAV